MQQLIFQPSLCKKEKNKVTDILDFVNMWNQICKGIGERGNEEGRETPNYVL